jgi:hypothetical protein
MSTGRNLESAIAHANQRLYDAGKGLLIRVPTHTQGKEGQAIPSKEPKVDFMGALGPRAVFLEAKSGKGRLTRVQKALLHAAHKCGALAIVHREDHIYTIDGHRINLDGRDWWVAIEEDGND